MATNYPTSIDTFTNPAGTATLASPDHASQHTNINDAVAAIETELGTLPKGSKASVKARLDAVDTSISTLAPLASPTFTGTPAAPTASTGTNTTQVATTAFVATGIASFVPAFPYVSGRFYGGVTPGQLGTTTSATVNTTYYLPFYVFENKIFDRIQIRSGSTFAGSGVVRLGIYNNSSGSPSTVLLDAGTVAPTAATTNYTITISQSLSVGWYWLAFNTQTAGTINTFFGATSSSWIASNLGTIDSSNNYYAGFTETVTVTSGFTTSGTLSGFNTPPRVLLRSA